MSALLPNKNIEIMKKNADKASQMLKLLSNSNRLMILCHLLNNELSVGELKTRIGLSQSALSQHLSKMKQDELLSCFKKGTRVFYSINKPEIEAILLTLYLIYCKD